MYGAGDPLFCVSVFLGRGRREKEEGKKKGKEDHRGEKEGQKETSWG